MKPVRIVNGALQPSERGQGAVLRGLIDPTTLCNIVIPEYQRGDLHETSIDTSFLDANTRLPDVELGMRGTKYRRDGDVFELADQVNAIDGAQRIFGALRFLSGGGDISKVEIGASVNLDTNEIWEKRRFEILNRQRRRVSTDLLARNRRVDHEMVAALYDITQNDETFPLHRRVSWNQQRARRDLIGGYSLLKQSVRLHQNFTISTASFEDTLVSSDVLCRRLGTGTVMENVQTFFNLIEDCWTIRELPYAKAATPIKDGFLSCLTRLISEHADFWKTGKRGDLVRATLSVNRQLRGKFKSFELTGHVRELASGSGSSKSSRSLLYEMLVRHINSGRRQHLEPSEPVDWSQFIPGAYDYDRVAKIVDDDSSEEARP